MPNPVTKMPAPVTPEMAGTPENRAEVLLQPIAAPSILGLYGFAAATFMVAAHIAHWYGSSNTELYLAPFAAVFGGLAQFLAGMWAFKARDALATAMHGMWGAFWIAYGILNLLFASGDLARPQGAFPALGFWFIGLAAITWVGTATATAESKGLTSVLAFLALGSTLFAIGQIAGNNKIDILAGWSFIISAVLAWYVASAIMLQSAFGKEVWPLGKTERALHSAAFNFGFGEPGVKHGQ